MLLRRDAVVHAEQAGQSASGCLGHLFTCLGKHDDTSVPFCATEGLRTRPG